MGLWRIKNPLSKNGENKIIISRYYIDNGFSGKRFDRPAFQKMLKNIQKGKFDCIVVKDLSRFGREYIDSGRYIERLFPALGVRFIAINDNYDSLNGKEQADEIIIPFKNLINVWYRQYDADPERKMAVSFA